MKDLDIRPDTTKLLEENIGQTLPDINDRNIFSEPPLREMTVKTKIYKWNLIKLKKFLHSKGNPNQNEKTTHRMGESICKRSNEGLTSKIYKYLLQLNTIKKMGIRSKQTIL